VNRLARRCRSRPGAANAIPIGTARIAVQSRGYPVFLAADGKTRGLDALDVFETCVEAAARYFANRP
jgi:hypothetical protein